MLVVAPAALLLWSAVPPAPGQRGTPAETNRVFLVDATTLFALELDGTIAWSTPLPALPGMAAGTVVDGRGFVWIAIMAPAALLRYTIGGALNLMLPIVVTLGTVVRMPAADAVGNCCLPLYASALGAVIHQL